MRNIIIAITFVCFFLTFATETEGQVRKRTTTTKTTKSTKEKVAKDETNFLDKGYAEIKFGNLGFFNGLSLSSKLNVGYKFHDRFSAGGGFKLFFNQYVVPNAPDPSLLDIGGFIHGRAKITKEIYFQGEYAFMKYEYYDQGVKLSQSANSPLLGLGYMSGTDKWRFGIEILYITSERARDIQNSIVEYWFGASYNF
ncbi:MAG: hypothetical protein IPN86_10715 [Saprospiraceae bacterium]|nr:hypothetical protein [Saprospiraceae bacterium]